MKKVQTLFLTCLLTLIAIGVQAQNKKDNTQTVKIKTSAVCDMCKKTMEKAMAYEKGVKSSNLDVNSKILTVVFDSRKTDAANIRNAVNKTGYDADQQPADTRAYNRLDDCCKKEAGDH